MIHLLSPSFDPVGQGHFSFPEFGMDYAKTLHRPDGSGFLGITYKDDEGKWHERPNLFTTPSDIDTILRNLPTSTDVYITQNRFARKRRRWANLKELNSVWADIDYYKRPELAHLDPWHVCDIGLEILFDEKLPAPSVAISSGQGIYFIWFHEPIGFNRVQEWKSIQMRIQRVLSRLNADRGAIDAPRVLRIVGTTNRKSGKTVEIIAGDRAVWDFEDLVTEFEIEPFAPRPADVKHLVIEAAKRGKSKSFHRGVKRNCQTLWTVRYEELQTLREYRWPNGIPEGFRHKWLFLAAVSLSWIAGQSAMNSEIVELSRHANGTSRHCWTNKETEYATRDAIRRAIRSRNGERIEFMGKTVDPRYRFRTDTILEWLEITEKEIRELGFRTLINDNVRRQINATDKARKRTQEGALPSTPGHMSTLNTIQLSYEYKTRKEYESVSENRTKPWEKMGISRAWYYRLKSKGNL